MNRWLKKLGMRWHGQNLNDKPAGTQGHWIVASRGWLWVTDEANLHIEWNLRKNEHCKIGLSVGTDHGFVLGGVAMPRGSLFLGLDGVARKFCSDYDWYSLDVSFSDWMVHANLWSNTSEWHSDVPWWKQRQFSVDLADVFLGKVEYAERTISEEETVVPMPEGTYPAAVRIFESVWRRPRWFVLRMVRADVNLNDNPIPFPGKGENSWDCGEDGTRGMTCPATTVEDAVAVVVRSVLRSRRRHGGKNWKPEEVGDAS